MTGPIEATAQMWAFVEERQAAPAAGAERIAWDTLAAIMTHAGRFPQQLHVLQRVALTEVAFGDHPPHVQAQWAANAAAVEAFLAHFPM